MIGNNSLAAIDVVVNPGHSHHATWNHCVPHRAPQPHEPEASLQISTPGVCQLFFNIMEIPFHEPTNMFHHSKSALNAAFSLIMWSCLPNCEIRPKIPLSNLLPGLTTLHAWFKCPANDCSSLFEQPLRFLQLPTSCLSFSSFSGGSLSCSPSESSSIPSSGSRVEGPIVFSSATGIPTSPHVSNATLRSLLHLSDFGGPSTTKSSK